MAFSILELPHDISKYNRYHISFINKCQTEPSIKKFYNILSTCQQLPGKELQNLTDGLEAACNAVGRLQDRAFFAPGRFSDGRSSRF